MICNRKKILTGFGFLVFCSIATAQKNNSKFEVGAALSSFIYQGDLTPNNIGSYQTIRWGINIQGSILLNNYILIRTNLAMGGLKGDDAKYSTPEFRKHRSLNFKSPVIELSQVLVWNPLGKNTAKKGISVYLLGGAGVSFLKIKTDWSKFDADYYENGSDLFSRIALDSAHSLPKIIPVLPLGIGIRYVLSSSIVLNAESSYRLLFTDYLDGFSQAGNPERVDHYQTIIIGAIYRIGNKNKLGCPVLKF